MNKLNIYLFLQTSKYIFINFFIISIFIIFLNLIEISRVIDENNNNIFNLIYFSLLKFPKVMNEIFPFVIIIGTSFLLRSLINNNELIAMRNIGYSILNIFYPIALSIFLFGIFLLIIINPISTILEKKYNNLLSENDVDLYSIKIFENKLWIKNKINEKSSSFIIVENFDFKKMETNNIKILIIDENQKRFIIAKNGSIKNNTINLSNLILYNITKNTYENYNNYGFKINFNKDNIIDSITNYKLVPFYNYISHIKTLEKFNLHSPEVSLFYISEILKPFFLIMLSFVVIGFSGKFKRNENFFKILFISILIGFLIFLLREIVTKLTISLSINFIISYSIIFLVPFFIGLYQIINIEND